MSANEAKIRAVDSRAVGEPGVAEDAVALGKGRMDVWVLSSHGL